MAKKTKKQAGYTDVYLDGHDDDGYVVFYTDTNGESRSSQAGYNQGASRPLL